MRKLTSSNAGGALPDGSHTKSNKVYTKAWRHAGSLVSQFLVAGDTNKQPWWPSSYDPDMTLCRGDAKVRIDAATLGAILFHAGTAVIPDVSEATVRRFERRLRAAGVGSGLGFPDARHQ